MGLPLAIYVLIRSAERWDVESGIDNAPSQVALVYRARTVVKTGVRSWRTTTMNGAAPNKTIPFFFELSNRQTRIAAILDAVCLNGSKRVIRASHRNLAGILTPASPT